MYFGSSVYYITYEDNTWTESRQDCRGRAADLVIINTKEKQSLDNKCGSSIYHISMMNWTESRQDSINSGADLVIINNTEEELGSGRAWISLSDRDIEGQWKWVDGTPLTTRYWHCKEPNNANDEDCAEVFSPSGTSSWNDRNCSYKATRL
ncbi:hypothetical protein QTP70_028454 [Hemibagrus guttatus]|uniref:C-type lectin domain-containing protein n=1 Tax=Hemibagrus guttatus TaxID=175788 RepID=A0AAE0PTR5_9TELE|nr:hypothetical protein QTP70_028454 [Hemibagrus guttatus]